MNSKTGQNDTERTGMMELESLFVKSNKRTLEVNGLEFGVLTS